MRACAAIALLLFVIAAVIAGVLKSWHLTFLAAGLAVYVLPVVAEWT